MKTDAVNSTRKTVLDPIDFNRMTYPQAYLDEETQEFDPLWFLRGSGPQRKEHARWHWNYREGISCEKEIM